MENNITQIGHREVWGGFQPFGISRADRRQHLYTIGRTGTGKTTLLRNLILQDIEAGHGVGVRFKDLSATDEKFLTDELGT